MDSTLEVEYLLGVGEAETHELDEVHSKRQSRGTRINRSRKARAKRQMQKEVREREHDRGYKGEY